MEHHCETCHVVNGHPTRVGALFRVMLSADEELYVKLERLSRLFHDADARAGRG